MTEIDYGRLDALEAILGGRAAIQDAYLKGKSYGAPGSVVLVSSPNSFTAAQTFTNFVASTQQAGTLAQQAEVSPAATTLALRLGFNSPDWSTFDSSPHDVVDLYLKSSGDGIFINHKGGLLPAGGFTFTADTASGTAVLSSVSDFTGLTINTPITGTGIPAGTTIASAPNTPGAGQIQISQPTNATNTGTTLTVARPAGASGGNAGLNVLIPAFLDGPNTGVTGSIPNNRTGQQGVFIQALAPSNAANPVFVSSLGTGLAFYLINRHGNGLATGGGAAFGIDDYSPTYTASLVKWAAITDTGKGILQIQERVGSTQLALRFLQNDGTENASVQTSGAARFGNYSNNMFSMATYVLQVGRKSVTGVDSALVLVNGHNAAADGESISFADANAIYAAITCVHDNVTSGQRTSSLKFSVKAADVTTEYLRVSSAGITMFAPTITVNDGSNFSVGGTTGTKIGTTTSQKLGFFNATPIVRPAASTNAAYVAGSSTAVTVDGTFTGGVGSGAYTIGGVVAALKNLGLIAS